MSAQCPLSLGEQNIPLKLILVVEDDEANAEVLDLALTQELPCTVRRARNGMEALQAVEDVLPSLMVLDYKLPAMDGLELYDQLQTLSGLSSVPVLFLSAMAHHDEIESRHLPFLEKPFALETLLEMLQRMLAI